MRLAGLWFVIAAASACVSPNQIECGRNNICPDDYACVPWGCASREQREACAGKVDGEDCATATASGVCSDGACRFVVCGNGVLEPSEVCDDGNEITGDGCNGSCTSDESCGNGVVERLEECDCGSPGIQGLCGEGVVNGGATCSTECRIVRCGNGVMEGDELCDDGNNSGGDGCSYDCLSRETCGNATLDFFAGEQCDDGNLRNSDGCSGTCAVETPVWQRLTASTAPRERWHHAMTFDPIRRRWVMFGGAGSPDFGDTWEYDGRSWTERVTVQQPVGRYGASMAFDAARKRIVMFGGKGTNDLDDTWELDARGWRRIVTTAAPDARGYASMVYDAERKRVVLFGGRDNVGKEYDDAWELDGTTWKLIAVTTKPAPRYRHVAVYDPDLGRMLVHGGLLDGDVVAVDTWALDGNTWSPLAVSSPPARYDYAGAYDVATKKFVLFGGFSGANNTNPAAELWQLDAGLWSQRTQINPPFARGATVLATDPVSGRMLMFAGNFGGTSVADTWALDNTTWTYLANPPLQPAAPFVSGPQAIAYDARRGRLVMYLDGDQNSTNSTGTTWAFESDRWQPLAPTAKPPDRVWPAMTYDATRDRIVLFGGQIFGGPFRNDTWLFDGTTWTQQTSTTTPSLRGHVALAYDPVRRKVVMYGGAGATPLDETWELDSNGWTQVTIAGTKPAGRARAVMVYDAARQRMVLFGGLLADDSATAETWEYDGTAWMLVAPTTPPPPARAYHGMAYDGARQRVVVFGGAGAGTIFDDVWELDRSGGMVRWREVIGSSAVSKPIPRLYPSLAYDANRNRVVLYGGDGNNDTWSYAIPDTSLREACTGGFDADSDARIGCADEDCWGVCSPMCGGSVATAACTIAPRCGDGTCNPLETCGNCPLDCTLGNGGCTARCGDLVCEGSETLANCPGDCTP